jgi:hypothetical protein
MAQFELDSALFGVVGVVITTSRDCAKPWNFCISHSAHISQEFMDAT